MPGKFHFELVSPEARLIAEDVSMVTIPGSEGDFGVLEGHSPLLSAIRPGVITINVEANDTTGSGHKRYFVAGGFADVTQTQCTVLAEGAEDLSLVDVTALDAEIEHVRLSIEAGSDQKLVILRAKRAAIG